MKGAAGSPDRWLTVADTTRCGTSMLSLAFCAAAEKIKWSAVVQVRDLG
jgi:hypothetical protein